MASEVPMQLEESAPASQAPLIQDDAEAPAGLDMASAVPTQLEESAPVSQAPLVQDDAEAPADMASEAPAQLEECAPGTQAPVVQDDTEAPEVPTTAAAPASAAETAPGAQDLVVPMAALVKPDKPKKNATPYWIYSNCVREEVGEDLKKKGEQLHVGDIMKAIGQRWKELPEAERKVYEDKAAIDKQRYETEMKAYKNACDPVASLRNKHKDLLPQRPLSPQALFSQDAKQRERALGALQGEGKETGERQVLSKLGDMWKEVSAEEKIAYQVVHTKLQLQFFELQKAWQATPECKEIEQAEMAMLQVQKAVELAKAAEEARLKQEKRTRPANRKTDETPPKRAKGAQQNTTQSGAKKPGKGQEVVPTRIDDKVLKEATKLGLAAALENLVGRPEVVSSRKSARAVLEALKASGGLVNPAKRALLGR